jgi:hypothetical protein
MHKGHTESDGYTVIGVPPLRLQHDFPGVTSVFEMGYFYQLPATYSRYLSLEFLHVSQLHQLTVIAEPKDFSAEGRLHLSGAGTCSILSALE